MERIETTYHATWHLDKSVIGIPSLTPTRLTRPANRARRRNMCSTSMAGPRAWSGSVAGSSRLSTRQAAFLRTRNFLEPVGKD